ncbi:hypothetical protein SAMN05192558_10233 [Actinokineospora alba]|uniref:Uncharacterized protein n=1 Tax=Actinokineospora alba TaxID=504798 RepID=A0A1H0HAB7_9PSEU|nr:AMED_5909 family protein [Actinokineospora alba]TDP64968.1 hypothetical protein C8E96_0446 [Actinokineospora alba]SDH50549.1 hypothetical protein SAMN05421871_101270 [Actinokineospora alba]SDO16053.1 hypothetical protein SAMN05192558_10233 [Actinokineospora alba]
MNSRSKSGREIRTLAQANELLGSQRPRQSAPLTEWLTFYRHSAAVYAEVAEIDRGHHHEALYWASRERARAEEIVSEIDRAKRNQAADLTQR